MFFDPDEDFTEKWGGRLPHRHQNGTIHLDDSLPQSVLNDLEEWITTFYKLNPKPWNTSTENRFRNYVSPYKQRMLDAGYGSCVLKYSDIREILSSALFFKDEDNYLIHALVIMPNHVHMLIEPFGPHEIEDILHSVKTFSARKINKVIGSSGKLWQRESWDRLVRSACHYDYCLEYIKKNPRFLPPDRYTLYIRNFENNKERRPPCLR